MADELSRAVNGSNLGGWWQPVPDKAYPGGAALATSTASPHDRQDRETRMLCAQLQALLEHFSRRNTVGNAIHLQQHRMLLGLQSRNKGWCSDVAS